MKGFGVQDVRIFRVSGVWGVQGFGTIKLEPERVPSGFSFRDTFLGPRERRDLVYAARSAVV